MRWTDPSRGRLRVLSGGPLTPEVAQDHLATTHYDSVGVLNELTGDAVAAADPDARDVASVNLPQDRDAGNTQALSGERGADPLINGGLEGFRHQLCPFGSFGKLLIFRSDLTDDRFCRYRRTYRERACQDRSGGEPVPFVGTERQTEVSPISEQVRGDLWERVADGLRAKIRDGILQAGDTLPAEDALAAQYEVHRTTVRRALTELTHEGLITEGQGRRGRRVRSYEPIIWRLSL